MGWVMWRASTFGVTSMYATPFGREDELRAKGFVRAGTPEEDAQKAAAQQTFKTEFGGKKQKLPKGRFKERGRRTW